MKNALPYILALTASLVSVDGLASSVLAVYQLPEYPGPGQSYQYPPGLLFEVCSDGAVYRKLGPVDGAEQGSISKTALSGFQATLEYRWLTPVRTECKSVAVDSASIRIESISGPTIECSLYQPPAALKHFQSRISEFLIDNSRPAALRLRSICK